MEPERTPEQALEQEVEKRTAKLRATVESLEIQAAERSRASEMVRRRAELAQLIARISRSLSGATLGAFDAAVDESLESLARFVEVDRSYLVQVSRDGGVLERTHEWCAKGVASQKPRYDAIPLEALPWLTGILSRAVVVNASNLDELPAAARAERELLEEGGVRSLLVVPLTSREGFQGALGFDTVVAEKEWRADDIVLLTLVGEILVGILTRRRAEEALRESERRYALATGAARIGVWDWDVEAGDLYIDPRLKGLLGYTNKEIPNRLDQWRPHIHKDDRGRVARALGAFAEGRSKSLETEHRMLHKDGSVRWFLSRGVALRDATGKATRVLGTDADITEIKETEEALRRSEQRYQLLADNVADVIWMRDLALNLVYISPSVERTRGFTPEEAMAQTLEEAMTPASARLVRKTLAETLEWAQTATPEQLPGKSLLLELEMTRKDGGTVWAEVRVGLSVGQDGKPAGVVGVSRDIGERKQAEDERRKLEAQIQHAQKLESLGVLAGGVAHDFNNLLVGMLGQGSMALEKLPAGDSVREHVEKFVKAAERAADLSQRMLAYSGRGHFQTRAADLSSIVRENLHLLEAAVPKNVTLSASLSQAPTVIEADVAEIGQVVMNLVLNASEAIGEGRGSVTISTGFEQVPGEKGRYSRFTATELGAGRYVALAVRDDGCGMDAKTVARMCDPFFTTKRVGRGLGLSAVVGIVRGHRGGIEVDSSPGKGSRLRLLFPALVEAEAAVASPAPSRPSGGTILVIDDEEVVRETARQALEAFGWTVLAAESGAAGVAACEERGSEIALVVLDFSMPGMRAEETLREIREICPGVRVLLSSGYDREEALRRFQGAELVGFLQKPYKPDGLIAEIQRHVD